MNVNISEKDKEKINIGIPIKINLDININGKSEKITLTSSLIYIPPPSIEEKSMFSFLSNNDDKNKVDEVSIIPDLPLETYPRIPIRDVKLPVYHLNKLKYKEVVQFFFNKNEFSRRMEKWNITKKSLIDSIPGARELSDYYFPSNNQGEDEQDENTKRPRHLLSEKEVKNIETEKQNIELMIHLLFPTYSFFSNGYKTSMQYWNTSEPYLRNSYPKTFFSYLRYKDKIYTITNAVWLNDVFNVPFYQELIFYYEKYKDWKTEIVYHLGIILDKLIEDEEEKEEQKSEEQSTNPPKPSSSLKNQKCSNDIECLKKVIELLQKKILDKKDYERLFKPSSDSEFYNIYNKHLKNTISNQSSDSDKQTYFYNIIYSDEKKTSYSNSRMNQIIYEHDETGNGKKKKITNKKLLEIMMENIIDYIKHKGNLKYLKRGICQETDDKSICRPRKEISTFYYTGILYNSKSRNNEPLYEIFLLMDVIEGEVNKTNLSGIKCKYENQSIGKRLEFLTGSWPIWDLSNRRIFMKITQTDDKPMVTKTISDYKSNYSISRNNNNPNYNNETSSSSTNFIPKTVANLIEFDNLQSESKFKNALEDLKTKIRNFPQFNETYMNKVVKLDWTLNSGNTDTFLKWIQNTNKYPSPVEKESNDKYTSMDKQIYAFLGKIEPILQSSSSNTSSKQKIMDISNLMEKMDETKAILGSYISTNSSKNTPRPSYINYILEFYVEFLTILINYLEDKKNKFQGGDSSSEAAVGNDVIASAVVVENTNVHKKKAKTPKYRGKKTKKEHRKKKRKTRKRH